MKKIVIIVGKTGAGKSTLCRRIADTSQFQLLSFAKAGKEFAQSKDYENVIMIWVKKFSQKILQSFFPRLLTIKSIIFPI